MPEEFRAFGESWKTFHPNWDFRLWTDANRPKLRNEDSYTSARSFADKANILRYEILLEQGGVYIDTDFECQRSIEDLIGDERCFAARQWDGVINNAIIGAVPRHPAIFALVEKLAPHIEASSPTLPSVFRSGPFYFGPIVQRFKDVTIYPPELFYPYNWDERWKRYVRFEKAYAIHHWTLSGRAADQPQRSILGQAGTSCAHVVVVYDETCDEQRLIWTLEALCLQTATNFEVSIVSVGGDDGGLAHVINSYDGRLKFTAPPLQGTRITFAQLLQASKAPGILLLHGNCVADPDLLRDAVTNQSESSNKPIVAIPRFYPSRKFYEFKSGWPLDYDGLRFHSLKFKGAHRTSPNVAEYVAREYFAIMVTSAWLVSHVGGDLNKPFSISLPRVLETVRSEEYFSTPFSKPQITCLCAAHAHTSLTAEEQTPSDARSAFEANRHGAEDKYIVRPRSRPPGN